MDAKTWTRVGEIVDELVEAANSATLTMRETRRYRQDIKELNAQVAPVLEVRREQYVMARDMGQPKEVVNGLFQWYLQAQNLAARLIQTDSHLKDEQRHIRNYGEDYARFR